MFFLYVLLGITSLLYVKLIYSFISGWDKIKPFKKGLQGPFPVYISVVIAFRNEGKNLPGLLASLEKQSLSKAMFELILVNDHSTDNSEVLLNHTLKQTGLRGKTISLKDKSGKKQAVLEGIKQASGKLIVTTDADCTHPEKWLETIHAFYGHTHSKLIIGPVAMNSSNAFEHYQALDFLSLIAASAGAFGIGRPFMCNGANLAFEKEMIEENTDPLKNSLASGDDVFLLHRVKKNYLNQISYLKSEDVIVKTHAEKSFVTFINQRIRWASKSKAYQDTFTLFVAMLVLIINLSLLTTLILAFFTKSAIAIFSLLLILKSLVDFALLTKVSAFAGQKHLKWFMVPVQIINIFIIPFIAILSFFMKPAWKGRKI
jgi:poly-beta-1,6-N-acetyl-D-glucosamine synthase